MYIYLFRIHVQLGHSSSRCTEKGVQSLLRIQWQFHGGGCLVAFRVSVCARSGGSSPEAKDRVDPG